jgi:phosphotransferase system enzyme I (PtsP)
MSIKRDNIDLIVSTSELTSVFDKKSSLSTLLQDITRMVAEHMNSDVCSIYLFDEQQQKLVLQATVGLSQSSIGKVKLKSGEGITGIAHKELRAVREARATKNPAFKSFKGIDEEQYEAFLAVPIKKGLNRIGVITLQHRQPDYFSKRDTAALKAIASQLAASIENSQLLLRLGEKKTSTDECANLSIKGSGEGMTTASGRAYLLSRRRASASISYRDLADDDKIEGCTDPDEAGTGCLELDLSAFDKALELSMEQLEELQYNTDDSLSDVAGMIFTAHFLMLRDENFTGAMRKYILSGHKPDEAVKFITTRYAEIFEQSELPGIQEKVQDIRDLEHRLLANLYGESFESADYSTNIIIAENIFPSELVKIWLQKARGLVFYGSGVTAHISILARSLALPLFMTNDSKILTVPENAEILFDTAAGLLYINPSDEITASYQTAVEKDAIDIDYEIPEQSVTSDGVSLKIQANINIIHDIEAARNAKADGIGLYRSEFPFIIRNEFPSEEEQFRIYKKILKANGDSECIFRTLDIGGDKMPGYANLKVEANPFLGFRGIRFSLGYPEVFQEQLRAMLRAGAGRELKIMFPMISSLDEFFTAKAMVLKNIEILESEGSETNKEPLIGAMVEIPAAVEIISELSAAADFLSIGTNDLIMYTLAADRTNERVRAMYKPWHPAVLRSLGRIAEQALVDGTELSVCGEAASEQGIFRFLLGLGIRKFSLDPLRIPGIKKYAGSLDISACEQFAREALSVKTLADAEALFNI